MFICRFKNFYMRSTAISHSVNTGLLMKKKKISFVTKDFFWLGFWVGFQLYASNTTYLFIGEPL